jgi:hypothetical protein
MTSRKLHIGAYLKPIPTENLCNMQTMTPGLASRINVFWWKGIKTFYDSAVNLTSVCHIGVFSAESNIFDLCGALSSGKN